MDAIFRSIAELAHRPFNATGVMEELTRTLQLHHLELENLPQATLEYIQRHPGQTANHLITFLMMFFPGLAWAPVWRALGLAAVGPVAGGIFANLQRAFGAPLLLRQLQGAAMGGRAQAALCNFVRGAATFNAKFGGAFRAANGTAAN
ncbi:hypothetical protein BST61_g10137 [Cercospora zeina]